jgi:nicotinate-nucleotide adenylyltransferase
MRLGIFGGSFDPVHNAHLALAAACQQQAALDEVWFTPTAIQPLKQKGPQATNSQRVEMLNLAIRDNPSWRVCTLEIDRGGPSYTIDTLRQIHEELPEALLFFLMGADAARDAPRWRDPAGIFQLATPLLVQRANDPQPDAAALASLCPLHAKPLFVDMPPTNVSSSEIRCRIGAGQSIQDLVPPAVAAFIAEHGLYLRLANGD